ncbi:MAG: hypothetical protein JWQ35_2583 [Bacteriovoracaceae bacterium]|nr:hypothetical protein [Bacteriovoracaceae bacterium]
MFRSVNIEGVLIEHLGSQNEILSEQSLFRSGSFSLVALAHKFKLKRTADEVMSEEIRIKKTKSAFSVTIPSNFKMRSNDQEVWNGTNSSPLETSFTWKEIPRSLSIILPNQNKIRLSQKIVSIFSKDSPFRISAPLLGALTFHMISAALIVMTPSTPERKPLKFSVSLVQTQFPKQALNGNAESNDTIVGRMNETKQLFKSFRVKKNKNHTVIAKNSPTQLDRAFSEKAGTFKTTWSIDDEIKKSENPLNLSDAQVRAALQPAYAKLKECYEDVLIQDSSLKGEPQLRLDVNKAGKVSAVDLSYLNARASSLKNLKDCFLRAYQTVQLPKPNRDFQVIHTLVLNY